jgi:hypothetical protein
MICGSRSRMISQRRSKVNGPFGSHSMIKLNRSVVAGAMVFVLAIGAATPGWAWGRLCSSQANQWPMLRCGRMGIAVISA